MFHFIIEFHVFPNDELILLQSIFKGCMGKMNFKCFKLPQLQPSYLRYLKKISRKIS